MSDGLLEYILVDFNRKLSTAYGIKAIEDIEPTMLKWIEFLETFKNINFSKVIQLMENHPNSQQRFSSLIGIFYQLLIKNKEKALFFYNSTTNLEPKDMLLTIYYENKIINKWNVHDNYGVSVDDTFDFKSEDGDPFALYNLADCYFYGKGTKVNVDKAFQLCLKSAERGQAWCRNEKNEIRAFEWV
ncbi:5054_t:CDS:1 [Funneliformis mosseae]|uniref:5054_t:CDS:1 n=1 Tax=Funneliformis mosseae TaxID=27381 RepID=A0A9N9N7P2_FUNMO|nr:5054_t:CDS:1 [Funneliformis mosseae]